MEDRYTVITRPDGGEHPGRTILGSDRALMQQAASAALMQQAAVAGADDPRVSVAIQEDGATLTLFFKDMARDAQLLEVRLAPMASGKFEPWRLLPNLPLHVQYARARLADDDGDVDAALRALRQIGSTRRGLSDDFLRLVARKYEALVAEGEPYPAKALAQIQHADKSTVSRWIKAARERGLLKEDQP